MKEIEIKTFVENFAGLFDDTPASEFTPETKFRDFEEWSSLIGLGVIAMVDEEYEVTLKGDDVRNSNTIEELFNIVKNKMK
jgi:acyl carrier protein